MREELARADSGFVAGSRIASYLVEEQIGQGGMAVVFRAHDERFDRQVALKILAPALAEDQAFRQRFIRESRAAAAVDDPHIIPVFEAGEASGVLFIAMRYVRGGDVRSLVTRFGPLPPARVAEIVSQVASALDAAHTLGLVHRDVKPANMLLDGASGGFGRPDHVYLSDFGLSKASLQTSGLTGTGTFLGTLDYISPEQIAGKPVDGRADEYSLACAAFELLCGAPPFQREEAMAVMYAQLSEPPPALTSRRPDLPPAADRVFAKALAKAPASRYASCREFCDALREAFGIRPYDSGPGAVPVPPSRSHTEVPLRNAANGNRLTVTVEFARPQPDGQDGVSGKANSFGPSAVARVPGRHRRDRPGRNGQRLMRIRPDGSSGQVTRAGGGLWHRSRLIARWARGHLGAWIVGAASLDAALVALVAALITVPGQSGVVVSGLVLALVVLLVLSVVFPMLGHAIDAQDRGVQRDHAWRERVGLLLLRGSSGKLPRLSELADDVLGATPTRYTAAHRSPYVVRQHADETIRWWLGAPGPPYPFVIVWGTTKAGKSRTLAEALRAVFTDDPVVVVPRDGQALAELSRLGIDVLVDRRPAVVVLDDLTPGGLEALTPDVLDHIRGWAVIAATMTAQRRADVLRSGSDVGAIARAALAAASGEYELASGPPVGAEKAEAERLYPEERFDGSVAETLVGARELIALYRASYDSAPAGCAIVRAAVDSRRGGLSRPLTDGELWRLFSLYLPAVRVGLLPTKEQFAEGIRWATRPVTSQVALLRLVSPSQERHAWAVFDHAVSADDGHGGNLRLPMPADFWPVLIDIVPPNDAFAVAMAAYAAGETAAAVTAFRKAATSSLGDLAATAADNLGILLEEQGDLEGARAAYQRAIDTGHPDQAPKAAFNLGVLLEELDDVTGARAAYKKAINSRHANHAPKAAVNLGNLRTRYGDSKGARAAYQKAIVSDHPDHSPGAAFNLGVLLADEGDREGAQAAYQKAIDSRHARYAPMAAVSLGMLLAEQGDLDGARAAYHRAIDSGVAELAATAQHYLDELG